MKDIMKLLVPVVFMLFLITGCWDQKIYEQLGFILNVGMDKEDDRIQVTYSTPLIDAKGEAGTGRKQGGVNGKTEVEVATTYLLREAREMARLSSSKNLEGGKIQNILIGSNLAMDGGITEYLEIFERDVFNTVQAWLIVVDGNANEFIRKGIVLETKPRLFVYLNSLINNNSRLGYCPPQTMIRFDIEKYIPGLDPVAPLVRISAEDIHVLGCALFDDDHMTGRLDTQENALLMLMNGESRRSELFYILPQELQAKKKEAAFFVRNAKTRTKLHFEGNIPVLDMEIKLLLTLDEYTWDEMGNEKKQLKMEQAVEKLVKDQITEVFNKLEEARCDALGVGDKVRAYYNRYWMQIGEEPGWKKLYPKTRLDLTVKAEIVRYGGIE